MRGSWYDEDAGRGWTPARRPPVLTDGRAHHTRKVLTMTTPLAAPPAAADLAAELLALGPDLLAPIVAAQGPAPDRRGLLCLAGDLLELAALVTVDTAAADTLRGAQAVAWGAA